MVRNSVKPPPTPPPPRNLNAYRRQSTRANSDFVKEGSVQSSHHQPSTITTSNSTSFSNASSSYLDDPDTESIFRGAHILRQQFLERRATFENKSKPPEKKERLFSSQDEEVLHDLLKSQSHAGAVENEDAAAPASNKSSPAQKGWTDPWDSKAGAFEATQKVQPACNATAYTSSKGESAGNNNNKPEADFSDELWPVPPEYDLGNNKRSHQEKPSVMKYWNQHRMQEHKEQEDTTDWHETAPFPNVENAAHWANLSSNDPSFLAGPIVEEEDSFLTLAEGPLQKETLNQTVDTTMSENDNSDDDNEPELRVLKIATSNESNDCNKEGCDKYTPSLPSETKDTAVDAFQKFMGPQDQALFDDLTDLKTKDTSSILNPLEDPDLKGEDSLIAGLRGILEKKGRKKKERQQLDHMQKSARNEEIAGRDAAEEGHKNQQLRASRPATLHEDFLCGANCNPLELEEELRKSQDGLLGFPCDDTEEGTMIPDPAEHRTKDTHDHRKSKKSHRNRPSNNSNKPPYSFKNTYFELAKDDKFRIVSPISDQYTQLRETDQAFRHAMNAGSLWQSIVGQHVRFPLQWWEGHHRTAPLGCNGRITAKNKWIYYDRHRIKGDIFLNKFVPRRDSPGSLLLHIIVQDFMTSSPVMDIAIGCFHPNAKTVRPSEIRNKRIDDCRDIWLATRSRTEEAISVIDPNFLINKLGEPKQTPLGDTKRRVGNHNVRAIFGETPPIRTIFAAESEIYEILAGMDDYSNGPADELLRKYLYTFW